MQWVGSVMDDSGACVEESDLWVSRLSTSRARAFDTTLPVYSRGLGSQVAPNYSCDMSRCFVVSVTRRGSHVE